MVDCQVLAHAEQLCVRCGSEGQPCCKDSNTVYCAGSNMECSKGMKITPTAHLCRLGSIQKVMQFAGVCMVAPGPCDQIGKACCSNSASNVQYCSSEVDRLTCNVLVEGEDTAKCEHCGGANEPCCFPNSVDANSAAARDLAGAFPACQSDEQACMLDAGSADFFGKCGALFPRNGHSWWQNPKISGWMASAQVCGLWTGGRGSLLLGPSIYLGDFSCKYNTRHNGSKVSGSRISLPRWTQIML